MQREFMTVIGEILMRSALRRTDSWSYAGYMFEPRGDSGSAGEHFLYRGDERLVLDFAPGDRRRLAEAFRMLRDATRAPGGNAWIKCIAVLRRDGDMRMLFEFDDPARWSITPENFERAFDILVRDVYPQA